MSEAPGDLDFRTRRDSETRALDFEHFFRKELPELLAGENGRLAARGFRALGLVPLAFRVADESFTLAPDTGGERMSVRPGEAEAAAVVELEAGPFSDLMQDISSTMGLTLGNDVAMQRGGADDFVEWEPVLRALTDAREVYEPGAIQFQARDGSALDLDRSFDADDDPAELAHFLAEAGFLHIRSLFERDEMHAISADIDRALPTYTPDDGRSWWGRTADGAHRPVRLQYFQEHSPTTAALLRDPRHLRIAALSSNGHKPSSLDGENAIEALVKPLDIVEGISDLPWHKDCSLGRHSFQCCGITVGICVTDADRESGELGVVAGSHRASVPPVGLHRSVDLPRRALPASAGDVTVHLSCTLHMSRPPTSRERRVLYTGFGLPLYAGEKPVGAERIRAIRENAPHRMGAESRDELGRLGEGSFDLDS